MHTMIASYYNTVQQPTPHYWHNIII